MIKDEIAMDYKKELKKRISADYEKRVKQWMAADPSQLIDAAEEITAVRLIRDNIEDAINEEDARFLLRLDEPLDEMADRWIAENWQTAGLRRMVWMPPMVRSCSTASGRFGRNCLMTQAHARFVISWPPMLAASFP